jgi:peptidoglycan/LPS O-acetylase OafA/YrhL
MIEKPSSASFLPCLHLVRGICAIGVACYHFSAWRYDFVVGSVGTFGVYTFFTLSALVLLHRHQSDFSNGIERSTLVTFYRLRIARVMPLLACVAIFGMVFVYFQQGAPFSYTWRKTFLTASGLMALHMPGIISTTTGAWSLDRANVLCTFPRARSAFKWRKTSRTWVHHGVVPRCSARAPQISSGKRYA